LIFPNLLRLSRHGSKLDALEGDGLLRRRGRWAGAQIEIEEFRREPETG